MQLLDLLTATLADPKLAASHRYARQLAEQEREAQLNSAVVLKARGLDALAASCVNRALRADELAAK